MRSLTRICGLGVGCLLLVTMLSPAVGQQAVAAGSKRVVILDTTGFWRMHHTLKMPVIRDEDGLRLVPPAGQHASVWKFLLQQDTPPAPADWRSPDFDDSGWVRGPAGRACRTPYLARLCMRGKFTVTDPAKVKALRLSVDYHGGIVVHVNGKELAREHLAEGDSELAEPYPEEAFVSQEGSLLALRGSVLSITKADLSEELARRMKLRRRVLKVEIPGRLLRKGMNVLAIEIVRSPYHKVLDRHKVRQQYKSKEQTHDMSWNTCQIRRVQLTAADAQAVVPNATRPQGLQVWNSSPLATDFDLDFGDRAEPLSPIRLVGAINGSFSGKVVVGSNEPIRGLRATAGDLTSDDGATIPAAQVRVRYALPWGSVPQTNRGNFETTPYPAAVSPLMALDEQPLVEFPVRVKRTEQAKINKYQLFKIMKYDSLQMFVRTPGQPDPVFGAVVPVWVTVRVPKGAPPGLYKGRLAIRVKNELLANVPVELRVVDWTLPDPQDYRTWIELIQSPDTLAMEYGVEPWSDEHFALIAGSFRLISELGSRVVYVPLIGHTNLGNEESMVRWIEKGDGRFEYDFSIMDRYLDTAAKHLGKPKVVVFSVWDLYVATDANRGGPRQAQLVQRVIKRGLKIGLGPLVTVVDPKTGKAENAHLPPFEDPSSKDLWKPLFDQLRARMAKRGLAKTMMLGMLTDAWPSKSQVQFMKDVSGGLQWANASHYRTKRGVYGLATAGYQAHAFGSQFGFGKSKYGWQRTMLNVIFERWGSVPNSPIVRWRHMPEYCITGNMRGVGRLGADYWSAVKDTDGRRRGRVWERYPESHWRVLNITTSLLAPGAQGAVATTRLEALREGVQECEARIVLEEALTDEAAKKKLGDDLARRCQQALDERSLCMWRGLSSMQVGPRVGHAFSGWRSIANAVTGDTWFQGSLWQQRSRKLYTLAGEVTKKLGTLEK